MDTDVVVVGAGFSGLLTALGLARAGVRVTVLGAGKPPPALGDPVVCHWSVLDGMHRLGVLDELVEVGQAEGRWCLRVLSTGEQITFDLANLASDVAYPFNVHVGHRDLVHVLRSHLQAFSHASLCTDDAVTGLTHDDAGVAVTHRGPTGDHTLRAGWVVGADGTHSTVRRSLGLAFPGLTWPELWVAARSTFDFAELDYEPSTFQVHHRNGALVQRSPGGGSWRYLFTHPATGASDLEARARAVLAEVIPGDVGTELTHVTSGRMYERMTDRSRVGRVVLVGHAAHVANPLTAFGLTAPFQDAYAVVEPLVRAVADPRQVDGLDAYAADRRRAFLEVSAPGSADRKNVVFQIGDPVRLDRELEVYRHGAATPARQREFLLSEHQVEPVD